MKNLLFLFALALCLVQCGEPATTTQEDTTATTTIDPTDDAPPVDIKPKTVYVRMTPESFREKLETMETPQLIDVRTPAEYEAGHIEGATLMNYKGKDFKTQIATLKKDEPVFVYCQAGGRSQSACGAMRQLGFMEVYELKDGYSSWK